jgi:hypothetical protein
MLFATAILISSATLSAKNLPATAAKVPVEFKQEIINRIDYPTYAQYNFIEGEVWLKLALNENSELRVIDISSTDQKLGKHVKKELSTLFVENAESSEFNVYYLKLKFDLVNF